MSDPNHRVPWDEAIRYRANYGILPYGWTEREVELEREYQRQLVAKRQAEYMNMANQSYVQTAPRLLQNAYNPPVSQPAKAAPVQPESTQRYYWPFYRPTQQEQDDALVVASMHWMARAAIVVYFALIYALVF